MIWLIVWIICGLVVTLNMYFSKVKRVKKYTLIHWILLFIFSPYFVIDLIYVTLFNLLR